ncbi:MAG: zinc ABC transporter solute-binding protein [Bacteriovoracaceae bacterium]|jgi:ABC-type Zn uptake system ZnuABC Zn-binding protein ZnuA|nr:zinc ABC transporter solute-binding protein [Bacteriovoracaceae bacterium]
MKSTLLYLCLLISSSVSAKQNKEIISCTHIQVCNALKFVMGENSNFFIKNLINNQHEDPHHFEPSVGDIKALMKADFLVLPPHTLQPWLKNIERKRSSQKKTYQIIEKNSHFWLDHNSLCSVISQVSAMLPTKVVDVDKSCHNTKKHKLSIKLKKYVFILLHDSMGTYFKELSLRYVALKGHGHLESYTTSSLKNILKIKKNNANIVWIYEKQIPIPESLTQYVSKTDTIIKINTLGRLGTSPFEVLNQINKELGKL